MTLQQELRHVDRFLPLTQILHKLAWTALQSLPEMNGVHVLNFIFGFGRLNRCQGDRDDSGQNQDGSCNAYCSEHEGLLCDTPQVSIGTGQTKTV